MMVKSYRGHSTCSRDRHRAKKSSLHLFWNPSSKQRHHIFHEDRIEGQYYRPTCQSKLLFGHLEELSKDSATKICQRNHESFPVDTVHNAMTLLCNRSSACLINIEACVSSRSCNPRSSRGRHPLPLLRHFYELLWIDHCLLLWRILFLFAIVRVNCQRLRVLIG